jgi:hypothetical protein
MEMPKMHLQMNPNEDMEHLKLFVKDIEEFKTYMQERGFAPAPMQKDANQFSGIPILLNPYMPAKCGALMIVPPNDVPRVVKVFYFR